jgi:preprotein translocase subunit SecD
VESLAQESEVALDSAVDQLTTIGEQAVSRLEAMGERAVNRFEEQIADLEEQQARRMAEMTEAFETQLQALQEEKAQLQSEFEALRRGSIILASRTLFGNLRNVSPETILQAVQIRAADPSLTTDEVRDQVNADLPEEAEPLHNKHIQAIFALYFNEYE